MRTNLDEMASNVSDGVVKLTDKYVYGERLYIARSRITVCHRYNDGWRVHGINLLNSAHKRIA